MLQELTLKTVYTGFGKRFKGECRGPPSRKPLGWFSAETWCQTRKQTEIDAQLFLLRDKEKRYSAAFGKLIAESQNAHSVQKCYCDQRYQVNQKIQAKIAAERQECFLEVTAQGERR